MLVLALLLILLTIIIIMLFTVALKMDFIFDTNSEKMKLTMLWLDPFLKGEIFMQNKVPILEVYLFHLKLFKKALNQKRKTSNKAHGMQLVQDLKLNDVNLVAKYGLQDKFMLGVICWLVNFLPQFIKIDYFEQDPDFLANSDYIYLRVTADLNIMPTLKSLTSH